MVEVFTDGSSYQDRGGWAWVRPEGDTYTMRSGYGEDTTNQRTELEAAMNAVTDHMLTPITVVSDSAYVVNCFHQSWWVKWVANGWKNSGKKAVKNRDLWEPFIEAVMEHGAVEFRHVRGHAGELYNEVADYHAGKARVDRQGTPIANGLVVPDRVLKLARIS